MQFEFPFMSQLFQRLFIVHALSFFSNEFVAENLLTFMKQGFAKCIYFRTAAVRTLLVILRFTVKQEDRWEAGVYCI